MPVFDGALALKLDFGTTTTTLVPTALRARSSELPTFRWVHGPRAVVSAPDKYAVLAHRRHQAQIKARRVLGAS